MHEKDLVDWLTYLISIDRLDKFYHSKYWIRIKREVLREDHYECIRCKEQGRLTLLTDKSPVHHVNEVKKVPRLALSKFFVDGEGREQRQLISLCFDCHNKEHNRFTKRERFTNEERW